MAQYITLINKSTHDATAVSGQEVTLSVPSIVELPVPHTQVTSLTRKGGDLVVSTADGKEIVIHGFFLDDAPTHNSLVLQDEGGQLWLADVSGLDSLPVDTSVDPATENVFSSIDSINPLLGSGDTSAAADTSAATSDADAATASDADTAAPSDADATAAATAASGTEAGAGGMDLSTLAWLPAVVAVGGFATAFQSRGSASSAVPNNVLTIGAVTQNADGTLTVDGQAVQPGDQVTVTFPDNSTNTGTADPSGNYSIKSQGVQTSGDVSVTDTGANGSSSGSASQTWADTTPPQAPTVTAVTVNSDGTLTVSGKAEAGSTVTVTYADGTSAQDAAGGDGSYSIQSGAAKSGAFNVAATDVASNTGAATSGTPVTENISTNAAGTLTVSGTAAPNSTVTVIFNDGTQATDTTGADGTYSVTGGSSANWVDSVTAVPLPPPAPGVSAITINGDGSFVVSGSATAGCLVTVTFADGSTATGAAGTDGTYSIPSNGVETPGSQVSVSVFDPASGNLSVATTVTLLTVTGSTANTDGTLTMTGMAAPGDIITVTYSDGNTATGVAGSDGSYSVQSSGAETGAVSVTAAAPTPQVSAVNITPDLDGTITVAGTATPNDTVTVVFPDKSSVTDTVDSNGNYSIQSHAVQTSGNVSVTVSDASGNVSPPANTHYSDTTAPQPPAVSTVTSNSDGTVTVTGNAEPGSTVTVTYADNTTATGVADNSGHYSVKSTTAESGAMSVTATDLAGNESNSTPAATTDNGGSTGTAPQETASLTAISGQSQASSAAALITGNGKVTFNGTLSGELSGTEQVQINWNGEWQTVTNVTGTTWNYASTSALPDNTYTVETRVIDSSTGLTGSASSMAVLVDSTPPAETVTAATVSGDGMTVSGSLSAALVQSGAGVSPEFLVISMDGGANWQQVTSVSGTAWSYQSATPLESGTSVTVCVVDAAGNMGQPFTQAVGDGSGANPPSYYNGSDPVTVSTGTTPLPPGWSLAVTLDDGHGHTATINSATDPTEIAISTDGASVTLTPPASMTDGTYAASVTVLQDNGAVYSTYKDMPIGTLVIDRQAPAETITLNALSAGDQTISGTLGGALANGSGNGISQETLQISVDGGAWQTVTTVTTASGTVWSYHNSTPLSNGDSVEVRIIDAAGNESTPVTHTVTPIPAPAEWVAVTAISPDTGASSTDFVTGDGHLTVSGTLSSPLTNGETVQVSLDGGQHWSAATVNGTSGAWSLDNSANTLPDGLYVTQAHVVDASGTVQSAQAAQQVEVSASGTLNLSLQDVLSDANALTSAGSTQPVTINSGGVVSTVHLTEGVGAGANQWQNTGSTVVNGVTYDVYHNTAEGAHALADLLIQHGITVI